MASAYGYDTAGRLTGVAHTKGGAPLASVGYTLDDAGNHLTETATRVPGAGTTVYDYDPLNRLTAATLTSGSTVTQSGWTYDPFGNRTSAATNGATTYAAYDAADRLCWDGGATVGTCASPTGGATTYTNDTVGNRTGRTANGATTT